MQARTVKKEGADLARLELEALDLEPGDLVLLDSAPLIYLFEGAPWRRETAAAFFDLAERESLRLAASTLVWTELLAGPLSRGDAALASRYRSLLADSRRLRLIPLDVAIAEEAAALQERKLGLADLLHLATARVIGARAILSNDEALSRVSLSLPRGPRVFLLDELAFSLR